MIYSIVQLDFTRAVWRMKGLGNMVGFMLIKSEMISSFVCIIIHLLMV